MGACWRSRLTPIGQQRPPGEVGQGGDTRRPLQHQCLATAEQPCQLGFGQPGAHPRVRLPLAGDVHVRPAGPAFTVTLRPADRDLLSAPSGSAKGTRTAPAIPSSSRPSRWIVTSGTGALETLRFRDIPLSAATSRISLGGSTSKEAVMADPVAPGTRIGHVHLKVADLDRAIAFYSGVLGFELQQKYGDQAAFLSAGGYHHHIGLNTWESLGGTPPPPGHTGLYHTAILYPTRADLADALRRLVAAGIPLDGASDHGVSEALYLRDPDGNGVELYRDRAPEDWPRGPDGRLAMVTRRLNLESLLAEA
jgi:catechol 2,3-dioxygenase